MGLLTSIDQLNYTFQTEKEKKEAEKIQKQNEKIHKNNLKKALEQQFYIYFKNANNIESLYTYLATIQKREDLIFEICENINNKTNFDACYLNEIYNKSLKKIYIIFQEAQKHLILIEKEEAQRKKEIEKQLKEEEAKKEQAKKEIMQSIYTIIKILFILFFAPIAIFGFFLLACAKDNK